MRNVTIHKLRVVPVDVIREESPTVKSFIFKDRLCSKAKPGQFSMIWVPGFDEIPMSLSVDPETLQPMILVKKVGDATEALHRLSQGGLIGIRGPYGTFFKVKKNQRILVAAGGTGIAPMLRIALKSKEGGYDCDIILGAKDASEILFIKYFQETSCKVYPVTEDGSLGEKGIVQDKIEEKISDNYDLLFCCGPELMIKPIVGLALKKRVNVQASLERMMKCGAGICGSCELSGFRVCKEGPVFDSQDLKLMDDTLGRLRRSSSGKIIKVDY
jgi:dihydroorotate dehydrogenase electron transfer subunit